MLVLPKLLFQRHSLIIAASTLLLAAGCGEPVKVPTSYAKWEPQGDANKGGEPVYYIDYPEGWKADGGGGKAGLQWAEFKKGGCLIKCSTDQSSSLIGDIAGSTNTMLGGDSPLSKEEQEKLAPAARAHTWNKDKGKDEYSGYKEDKEPTAFQSGMGDARQSVFTGTLTGRKVKGYRATFLGHDRGVTVFCHCPEKDFTKMQPAFDKVLESVRRGG